MFPLFISLKIDDLTRETINAAPVDLYNRNETLRWVESRHLAIAEQCDPNVIFKDIYANMKPVVVEKQFLFLYGNAAKLMDKYGGTDGTDDTPHTWSYKVDRLGTLSHEPYAALRLPLDRTATYSLPIDANSSATTVVSKRISEAAAHCVPIWMTHEPPCPVPTFFTLRMSDGGGSGNDDDDDHFNMTIDNALAGRSIYPPSGGYAHEYVSSHMHITTLVLDCDLKLPSNDPRYIDEAQMYRDMVALVEQILTVAAPMLDGQLVHYLFKSTADADDTADASAADATTNLRKYGVHHHVCLPPPFVLSNNAACEIIDVLNSARYQYPNTIGIDCELHMLGGVRGELNDGVYDPNVYTRTLTLHKSTARGHGLRGPYQRKPNGKRPLLCVYRTDRSKAPIPATRLYVHAAHSADSPLVGSVIERFIGALPIANDNEKAPHSTATRRTPTTARRSTSSKNSTEPSYYSTRTTLPAQPTLYSTSSTRSGTTTDARRSSTT